MRTDRPVCRICTHTPAKETPMDDHRELVTYHVDLDPITIRYLDQLAKKGTHGTTASECARTFIEEGVRNAIGRGFLRHIVNGEATGSRSSS
jgi:hypothetical protein